MKTGNMKQRFLSAFKEAMDMSDENIDFGDNFRDFKNWSSLTELSVLAMMDSEFGVDLEMKDFNLLITVDDIYKYVDTHAK
jgi:acyl carrier protein